MGDTLWRPGRAYCGTNSPSLHDFCVFGERGKAAQIACVGIRGYSSRVTTPNEPGKTNTRKGPVMGRVNRILVRAKSVTGIINNQLHR